MKKILLIIIIPALIIGSLKANPDKDSKTTTKGTKSEKRTVLIIGLKPENITSNYFMAENIAERTSLAKDSLAPVFNRILSESISGTGNTRFDFICCVNSKAVEPVMSQVQYKQDKDMLVSDISGVQDSDFKGLLSRYNADYVIFLDNYYLKYQASNSLFHIVNYDIYDQNKKNIITGKTYFNSAELLPLENYQKNYKKAGAKIVEQLDKAAE